MEDVAQEELAALQRANREFSWLAENYPRLVEKYENSFVAIKDCSVIAASKDLDGLFKELGAKKIDPSSVMTEYVTRIIRVL